MIPLTPDEIAVGRALLGPGAQFSIGLAADRKPVAYVYVSGAHVATLAGVDVPGLLDNLARIVRTVQAADVLTPGAVSR